MFYENLTKCSKNIFDIKEIPLKTNTTNYKIKDNLINNSEKFIKHLKLIRSKTLNDDELIQNFDKEKILQ